MMMAVRKLQGIGLVFIVLFLAMALYPVSLRVASKRSELARVEHAIRATHENIRYLETELGARASLRQLERWNAENFAYSAPTASQYLEGERELAQLGSINRDEKQLSVVAPVEAATALVVNDSAATASDVVTAETQILAAQIKATPAVPEVSSTTKAATQVVVAVKSTGRDRHAERVAMLDTLMAKDSPVKKPEAKKAGAPLAKAKSASGKPDPVKTASKPAVQKPAQKNNPEYAASKKAGDKKDGGKKAVASKTDNKVLETRKAASKKPVIKKAEAKKPETPKNKAKKVASADTARGTNKP